MGKKKHKNTCLLCSKGVKSRGLCNTHHSEWNRARLELTESSRDDFEKACIKAGKLLPSRHTGKRKQGAFDDILAKFKGKVVPANEIDTSEDQDLVADNERQMAAEEKPDYNENKSSRKKSG